MKRYGNYVEGVSRDKLFKEGYSVYCEYWSDRDSQQNILTKLVKEIEFSGYEYLYTQKRDKTGLFRVKIYVRKQSFMGEAELKDIMSYIGSYSSMEDTV